jgi:demethylmenaquinone methyltransferase / 2-methoxy-6-polyprenyl-1,4-benzoquinol methylase
MTQSTDTTHFGFKEVPKHEKADRVAQVFHSVAAKYDLMNDLMSLGVHRLWKQFAVHLAPVRTGGKVLDLAGGTGDLARKLYQRVGPTGQVILADINDSMLHVGRDRLLDEGLIKNLHYIQVNAEHLCFPNNYFDCVTIGFGLRNVTEKSLALAEMARVLKPGGCLLVLEFSKPTTQTLEQIYDLYSFTLLPQLGQWFANDKDSYQYLAESIRKHPPQDDLQQMILDAGFDDCEYTNLTGGIVAIHKAYKY